MLAHNRTKGVALKGAEVVIKIELEHAQLNIITKTLWTWWISFRNPG